MAVGGDETSRSGRAIWRQALPLFVACVGASTRLGASALRAVPRSAARSRRGSALDCERVPDGLDRSQLWAPLTEPDLWPPSGRFGVPTFAPSRDLRSRAGGPRAARRGDNSTKLSGAPDAPCSAAYPFKMTAPLLTRDEIAAAVLSAFGADIIAVHLFGSFARGGARAESDVDLGLLYAAAPAPTLLGQPFLLEAQLSERLGRPVQCVVMNTAPADLVHQVLMDRVLLLDLEPSRRIRFEIDARNRYFDVKPLLDRYRRVESVA